MMAGASGEPELAKGSGKYHFPKGSPFCVLLKEDHFKEFSVKLAARPDITHVFLVTDSIEAFYEMSGQLGRRKRCVQQRWHRLHPARMRRPRRPLRGQSTG